MSLSVEHLRRALEPGFVLSTTKTLSDAEIAALRDAWGRPREPYREPQPLSPWVTMDPMLKLLILAVPVALLIWLLN